MTNLSPFKRWEYELQNELENRLQIALQTITVSASHWSNLEIEVECKKIG